MGPIWGRQDPGGPHVGPMNFAIWEGVDPHHKSCGSAFATKITIGEFCFLYNALKWLEWHQNGLIYTASFEKCCHVVAKHFPNLVFATSQYMGIMMSQITSNLTVCSAVFWGWQRWKHQSSVLLAICEGNPLVTDGFPSQKASVACQVINHHCNIYDWLHEAQQQPVNLNSLLYWNLMKFFCPMISHLGHLKNTHRDTLHAPFGNNSSVVKIVMDRNMRF